MFVTLNFITIFVCDHVSLQETDNHAIKFARLQQPAVGRGTRFSVPRSRHLFRLPSLQFVNSTDAAATVADLPNVIYRRPRSLPPLGDI